MEVKKGECGAGGEHVLVGQSFPGKVSSKRQARHQEDSKEARNGSPGHEGVFFDREHARLELRG